MKKIISSVLGASSVVVLMGLATLTSQASTVLTAPVITGATSTQTTATINWTGSTGGVPPITYSILRDGTSVGTTTASTTAFTDTGLTPSTTYAYVVMATDSATPTSSVADSATSTVTTLASSTGGSTSTIPMVSIVSPANNTNASGTITVTVNATDTAAAIKWVKLFVDGVFGLKAVTSSPYVFSLNTALLSSGTHTLTARAGDTAGNVGTSTAVSIIVGNNNGQQGGGDGNGYSDDDYRNGSSTGSGYGDDDHGNSSSTVISWSDNGNSSGSSSGGGNNNSDHQNSSNNGNSFTVFGVSSSGHRDD